MSKLGDKVIRLDRKTGKPQAPKAFIDSYCELFHFKESDHSIVCIRGI